MFTFGNFLQTKKTQSIYIFIIENLIRGLDDDEINFLDIVDKAKLDAEKQKLIQDKNEMLEFRQRVASLQEQTIEQVHVKSSKLHEIIQINFEYVILNFRKLAKRPQH